MKEITIKRLVVQIKSIRNVDNIDINEYFRRKLFECIAKEESRLFLYKEKNK